MIALRNGGEAVAAVYRGADLLWQWSPEMAFLANAGLLLDVSRRDLLAQDAAGAVPANQPGQPVGLIRRRAGTVDAAQATSAARPTLVRMPATGRRNRVLPSSEALSLWALGGYVTAAENIPGGATITAVAGTMPHELLSYRDAGPSNADITVTLEAKAGTETVLVLQPQGQTFVNRWTYRADLTTGVVTSLGGAGEATNAGAVSQSLGDGWWKFTIKTKPQTSAGVGVALRAIMRSETAWAAVGTETLLIRKVQIETGTTATAYQTVTSTADVTEAGVPDTWRASLDGVDDRLLTPALAMASDEVTLVMAAVLPATGTQYGVLRIEDAGGRIGVVKSADNLLRFHAGASSVPVVAPATPVSGAPEVWTMQAKITASQITIRRNGVQVAASAASQGTGQYPTGALEIGTWAGGQWGPLRLYGLMLINRVLTPHELTLTERWAGSLCGVSI